MVHLSRRQFLKCVGVTLLASAAAQIPHLSPSSAIQFIHGRALRTLPVYAAPFEQSEIKARMWSDSVVPIQEADAGWYLLQNGYAKREAIQPMVLKHTSTSLPALPFWAEVGGSVAVVRQWCAADAPLVARIGHGGVARVVDMLPGAVDWYAVADEDSFLGWSQAAPWHPVAANLADNTHTTLIIDTQARQIEVLADDEAVLRAPVALGDDVPRGTFHLQKRRHSVKSSLYQASSLYGAPWQLQFGAFSLVGAYWHNQFGKPGAVQGAEVQVTPAVAGWLFARVGGHTPVIVR